MSALNVKLKNPLMIFTKTKKQKLVCVVIVRIVVKMMEKCTTHKLDKPQSQECSCEREYIAGGVIEVKGFKKGKAICKDCGKPIPEKKVYNEDVIFMCKKHTRVNCGECFEVLPKPIPAPQKKIEELNETGMSVVEAIYRLERKINEIIKQVNGG